MKCSCADAAGSCASYERLPAVPSTGSGSASTSASTSASVLDDGFAFDARLSALRRRDDLDKDASNEKEEELVFFNDDGSFQTAVVGRDLRASDLCQLLALKNRVAKDVNWTLVEHWVDFGLERNLEDHEEVLAAHWDMQCSFGRRAEKRFVFRKDFRKYEFFHNPQQFFPADMVDMSRCEELTGVPASDHATALQTLLLNNGDCPPIFSHVWVREANKQVWNKAFLLLKNRCLYLSYKIQVVAKFLRSKDGPGTVCSGPSKDKGGDADSLQVFASLVDYNVYTTLNAKNQFRAPTEFGLFLRPTASAAEAATEDSGLRCLACESERARLCWVTAMRLAKYGKQLRENYRAFKNKQVESNSPKEYNSYTVPNESVRSRVAMDFTGSVGRIVEDPKEAKAIAVAEGYSWKRRWRPTARHSAATMCHLQGLESGVHITQPWFHSGMSRDQAAQLISRHGTVDGVFLVRESRSSPGSFVLTFKCGSKVLHTQIQPVMDPVREALCYSLDSGVTKFYDLLQLVEFYQLNAGCLPTRLTHYVVQSPSGLLPSEKSVAHSPASF
ncbi:hypothetical protein R5R35_007337 [Gryllus longicercus]|uniref:Growth factor receptor-bound protein 14 n=1 Tax=Gryllus longicercus TaxID=2509291 RepID=A0AAN9Z6E7_9ORTH